MGFKIVKEVVGHVCSDTGLVRLQYRRDENAVAEEELILDIECVRIFRVLEEERSYG